MFARTDGIRKVRELSDVPVITLAGDHLGFAIGTELQCVFPACEIIVGGGVFKIDGVGHPKAEALRHCPSALGVHHGTASNLVASHHMIDATAEQRVAA